MDKNAQHDELDIPIGKQEFLVITRRYEVLYNLNDILIGLMFLVGSVFFFWEATKHAGIWLFVLGSLLLLIRPLIRIKRKMHLEKIRQKRDSS
ncbi:YrhK family protein [Bacillus tianshenii]|nr:YrhK family protein [Bacillus tianshenii]